MSPHIRASLALLLLASACALLPATTSARRVLHDSGHGAHLSLEVHPLAIRSVQNISGVWVGLGDQYSAKVWDAYFATNALPNCSATNTSSTYKHWAEPFPDTLAFAWSEPTKTAFGINGHHDGAYVIRNVSLSIVNGSDTYLKGTYEGESESFCARFDAFVDPRDGLVYSRITYASDWRKGADGKVTTKDVSCSVAAGTKAGCYTLGANAVRSVSVASYACKAGACLKYSPAYAEHES